MNEYKNLYKTTQSFNSSKVSPAEVKDNASRMKDKKGDYVKFSD